VGSRGDLPLPRQTNEWWAIQDSNLWPPACEVWKGCPQ